ncbi:hypothetical protein [Rubellicoccus peritrichatus]|uniref:Uncharacterized protein n=1 Tax=Rubellicoccus peritrichatus TaxID=3080537 RepID=A0AAQ3QV61_9BACT|nr:hypothetical protein [Puniceicoccus sp. CR14]WOO41193.1 hypothetical protein RZN69_21440 [Puniceicoccus sp. CR14]
MFAFKPHYFCLLAFLYAGTSSSNAVLDITIEEKTKDSTTSVTVNISGTVRFGEANLVSGSATQPAVAMTSGYGQIVIQGSKDEDDDLSEFVNLYTLPTSSTWTVTDSSGSVVSTTDLTDLTASTLNFGTATTATKATTSDADTKYTFALWLNSNSDHPGSLGFTHGAEDQDEINTTNVYENTTLDDLGLTTEYSYTLLYGDQDHDEITITISSDTDSSTSDLYDVSNDWVFISDVLAEGTWLWSTVNATWVFISANLITDDEDENNNARFAYVIDQEDQNSGEWRQLKTTSSSVE